MTRKMSLAAGLAAALMAMEPTAQAFSQTPASAPPAAAAARLQPLTPATTAQPAPPVAGAETHTLEAGDLSTWLDGMVPYALKAGNIAGAVVIVVKDGKVLSQKGYGYADVAAKTRMDPERTLIRPGSTSKLFTWTAVMQMVQAGKINLDADVNTYLDFKVPEVFGKPITMRDLMNHRAGFEEGLKDVLMVDPKIKPSTESYLKNHARPMLFAPGETPAYSNYGAALAGYIVQRVSGEPFERYVDEHIYQPLGMTHSTFEQPAPAAWQAQVAKGYRTADAAPMPFELVTTAPAGSMSATAADMGRFMIAQLNGGSLDGRSILSPQTTALMQSPSESGPPGFAVMAHGFFYDRQNGRLVIGHGGDTIVFHSELDLLPQEHVGIFYNFNSRGAGDAVYGARKALFDGFMDRYFPAPPEPQPPTLASARTDAQEIAGRYESSRRIEHGFLSALYLLSQSVVTAHPDGTITAPAGPVSGPATFREVGPQLWRKVGGTQELALTRVHGVKTVLDSEDPVTVLSAVPGYRSEPLILLVFGISLAVLLWTLLLWPLSPLLRRGERAASGTPAPARRWRLVQRGAVVFDILYLFGWLQLIQPVLSTQLQVYNAALDPMVALMEGAGLLAIAAAAVGLWSAWRMGRTGATRLSQVWSWMVGLSLVGVVWFAFVGGLLSWRLNY